MTLFAIYVIGGLFLYFYPTIRVFVLGQLRSGVLTDGDLGLACVRMPRGWRAVHGLSREPAIQVGHGLTYCTITSEAIEDLDPDLPFEAHARLTHDALAMSGRILALRGPELRRISDFPAVIFEIEILSQHTALSYLHVVIEGRRARHHVLAWTNRSRFKRERFEELLAGFSEAPGPEPTRPAPLTAIVQPSSKYDVH